MDIELAIDVMEMSERVDHVVIFSGDGDFRKLVEAVQRKGRRVSVCSTIRNAAPNGCGRTAPPGGQFHRTRGAEARDHARRRPPERAAQPFAEPPDVVPTAPQPPADCPLCPRLAAFRDKNRAAFPDFFNAPVPSFGALDAPLLIVGLAPGLKGANRTGRPFTGDYAGELLYGSLARHGLARGIYGARSDDGFELLGVRISNAVRCVPPENKPIPAEIKTCRQFLSAEIAAMPNLKAILALGQISHDSVSSVLALRRRTIASRMARGMRWRA